MFNNAALRSRTLFDNILIKSRATILETGKKYTYISFLFIYILQSYIYKQKGFLIYIYKKALLFKSFPATWALSVSFRIVYQRHVEVLCLQSIVSEVNEPFVVDVREPDWPRVMLGHNHFGVLDPSTFKGLPASGSAQEFGRISPPSNI